MTLFEVMIAAVAATVILGLLAVSWARLLEASRDSSVRDHRDRTLRLAWQRLRRDHVDAPHVDPGRWPRVTVNDDAELILGPVGEDASVSHRLTRGHGGWRWERGWDTRPIGPPTTASPASINPPPMGGRSRRAAVAETSLFFVPAP